MSLSNSSLYPIMSRWKNYGRCRSISSSGSLISVHYNGVHNNHRQQLPAARFSALHFDCPMFSVDCCLVTVSCYLMLLFECRLLCFGCRLSAVVIGRSLLLVDYCVSGLVVFFIVGRRCPALFLDANCHVSVVVDWVLFVVSVVTSFFIVGVQPKNYCNIKC
jgi:hypothetical protein